MDARGHHRRNRQGERDQNSQGAFDRVAEPAPIPARREFRKRGEQGGRDGRPEDCLRHLHHHPAVGQRGDRAFLSESGGQVVARQHDQLDAAHGQQARPHQVHGFDQAGVTQVERGCPAEAELEQRRDLDEQVQRRAEDHAVDQAVDAEARHEKDRAEDLADVVHDGRQRGQDEMLVGLQAGHHQSADREDDRANQVEAHQFGQQGALVRAEARCDADFGVHDGLGENGDEDGKPARDEEGHVGDAREQIPGGGAVLGGQVLG